MVAKRGPEFGRRNGGLRSSWIVTAACALALAVGCAKSVDFPEGDGGDDGSGASGGDAPSTGGSTTTTTSVCEQDCSQIQAPPCFEAVCNEGNHPGPVGSCVVIPAEAGGACEDGLFCTVNDACDGTGVCIGGPQNDCGLVAGECEEVTCDEAAQSCSAAASANGASCTAADLCLIGTTCQNGLCTGTANDCFFSPVPDECHVAVCNPTTGVCEPQPGNDGGACVDQSNLCEVGHTCSGGVCSGGMPKNCNHLSVGCNTGVCDSVTGQCVAQPIMNGNACNDQNNCTTGETCQNGSCTGGTAITQCIGGDLCCPQGCVEATDADCSCAVNHALNATPSSSGGGSGGYGPGNWNDGVDGDDCLASACSQCQGWISNGTTPSGAWMMYEWTAPVTIGSMHIDTADCNSMSCDDGRLVEDGEVQWWDGAQWVTATTFSNQTGDFTLTFGPALNTTKVRLFNVTANNTCGQGSNSLMYEWYVWPGSGCTP